MFLDQKPWIYLWSPLYRHFVQPVAWPIVRKLQQPFKVRVPLAHDRLTIAALDRILAQQVEFSQRLDGLERSNREQWGALEQLILNMLGQTGPGIQVPESDSLARERAELQSLGR